MSGTVKRVPPKPFVKGDPRINRGGRPKQLLTKAVAETLTDADARKIIASVIVQAKAGDLQAVAMLWDRLEGKPIARAENGQPGDFEMDFSDWSMDELRTAAEKLRRVK